MSPVAWSPSGIQDASAADRSLVPPGYIVSPSGIATGETFGAPFVSMVNLLGAGQSNMVGQDTNATGWPGGDPRVTFYDYNNNLGGTAPWTTLAPRTTGSGADNAFGPELTLANGLAAQFGPISYTKTGFDGTEISQWQTGQVCGIQLLTAIARVKTRPGKNVAFLWQQGETDGLEQHTQAYYFGALTTFMASVRAAFGSTWRVHAFIVKINKNWFTNDGNAGFIGTYMKTIQDAQIQYVATDADSELISLDSLVPNTGGVGTNIHYGNGEQLTCGTLILPQIVSFYQNASP